LAVSRPITSAAKNWKGFWTGTAGGGIYREGQYCDYNGRTIYSMHVNNVDGALFASITGPVGGTYYIIRWKADNNISCGFWDTYSEGFPVDHATLVYSLSSTTMRMFAASSTGVYYLPKSTSVWIKANGITGQVYSVVADPANANLLYAAAESGAYISSDGGTNWQLARNDLILPLLSVQVDANNPNIVYFGSKDGSTYRWDKTLP
jgi:hypothetical protein